MKLTSISTITSCLNVQKCASFFIPTYHILQKEDKARNEITVKLFQITQTLKINGLYF